MTIHLLCVLQTTNAQNMFGMSWKLIDSISITRARTAQERLRRHLYGECGATFSKGKYMVLGSRKTIGTITTFTTKDNLLAEVYET